LESLFIASTHSYVLVFSNRGKVYWLKVHVIPQAGRVARGKPIVNLVQLSQGEKVAAILPVRTLPDLGQGAEEAPEVDAAEGSGPTPASQEGEPYVFMATRKGVIKKTRLDQYARPRLAGIIALGIEEGDELIAARLTDGRSHVLLSTAQGMAIRFEESDVRAMGRGAYGVKGITLEENDAVVSAETLPAEPVEGAPAPTVLTVTANGYGKRTELPEYRVQSRGGKGIITIKTTERNGPVVAAALVSDAEEVMLITNKGMLIRMPAKGISVIGRNTQGVRLITVESKDEQVVAVARVAETSPEAEEAGLPEGAAGEGPVEEGPPEEEEEESGGGTEEPE
jgi:DNA gyrase subunit A